MADKEKKDGFFTYWIKKITGKSGGIWFNKKKKKTTFDKEGFKEAFEEIAPKVYEVLQSQNNSIHVFTEGAAQLYDWLSYNHAGFNDMGVAEQRF